MGVLEIEFPIYKPRSNELKQCSSNTCCFVSAVVNTVCLHLPGKILWATGSDAFNALQFVRIKHHRAGKV